MLRISLYSSLLIILHLSTNAQGVTLYEGINFNGQSKTLTAGEYKLSDFNDMVSSVKVPAGFCIMLYEHAGDCSGYGIYVDLLEDCEDLAKYNLTDKVSYAIVFTVTSPQGFVWARNRIQNGEFIPGHWERQRADGKGPDNAAVVAGPPVAQNMGSTTSQVNGAITVINRLCTISVDDNALWEKAENDQLGIIGSDFRGPEYIGTASFEREFHFSIVQKIAIGLSTGLAGLVASGELDNLNFWVPQQRENAPYKRTLSGTIPNSLAGEEENPHLANLDGVLPDHDLNIDITPLPNYRYLLTNAKEREYTKMMKFQYNLHHIPLVDAGGQPDCNSEGDLADFSNRIEAEITIDNNANATSNRLMLDLLGHSNNQPVCVYGPWIYDKGHCCHPEIHPAEQIWWSRSDTCNKNRVYNCNLICDASERFARFDQMDDGTKLRPWAALPIKGIFAIAFETETGKPVQKFEAGYIDHYNLAEYADANKTFDLVYQNKTLISFVPNNSAFKVSYERIGLVAGTNKIRGFLVLETEVGTNTSLKKGHYMFNITRQYNTPDPCLALNESLQSLALNISRKKANLASAKNSLEAQIKAELKDAVGGKNSRLEARLRAKAQKTIEALVNAVSMAEKAYNDAAIPYNECARNYPCFLR